jgi:8-oxo-dGTP pyrophosphatase MutT (NUDIX family)
MTEDQRDPWQVVRKHTAYSNPWITVTHHDVVDPGGRPGVYGTVAFANRAVGILPLDADDHTWLVGQWRFPLGVYSWEIPEGGAPRGEDPLAAAQRELKEETGLVAGAWEKILEMHLSNSVTDEASVSYVATGLTHGEAEPESTELLRIRRVPFLEAVRMVLTGEITDALSVATILRVWGGRGAPPVGGARG